MTHARRARRISIHALRKESDRAPRFGGAVSAGISIHALRKESDHAASFQVCRSLVFQSTLSVRRATSSASIYAHTIRNFNPRSP